MVYDKPKLIALINETSGFDLKRYSHDLNTNTTYNATVKHAFAEHCALLSQLAPFQFIFSILFLAYLIIWLVICQIYKTQTFPVQRLLAMIPALICLQFSLDGLDLNSCPWVSSDMANQAYLRMGRVCT